MNCDDVRPQLAALLDGELAETAAALQKHLEECAECAQSYREFAAVQNLADAWTIESADVLESVQAQSQAADMRLLLEEIRHLRGELRALRADMASLRAQIGTRATGQVRPSVLIPYGSPEESPLQLV
jgi:predicted anti-sigma-YlaC factor YlaD